VEGADRGQAGGETHKGNMVHIGVWAGSGAVCKGGGGSHIGVGMVGTVEHGGERQGRQGAGRA